MLNYKDRLLHYPMGNRDTVAFDQGDMMAVLVFDQVVRVSDPGTMVVVLVFDQAVWVSDHA